MRKTIYLILPALVCFAGCDVKDPIYNTAHPDHGTVTLTTDWSGIDKSIQVPESYTAEADGFSSALSGTTNTLDHLFEPGIHRIHVYNTPEHISFVGSTATVAEASGNADGAGKFVEEMPGWLFTCAMDATLEKDTDHALTAPMQQQVRQLTLVLELTGGTTDRIAGIEGYLSGAAATLDFDKGEHGMPSNVELNFTKITSGADEGKWAVTVRLLGVAGAQQQLNALIRFTGDNPAPVTLASDLSTELATFNADKATPRTLGGTVVETPTGVGFGATITDWETVMRDPIVAE